MERSLSTSTLRRIITIGAVLLVAFTALLVKILFIQTVDFDEYQSKVYEQVTTESSVRADRGNIYDADGNLLATSITTYRIYISPRAISKLDKLNGLIAGTTAERVSRGLSEILLIDYGVTYEAVKKHTEYTRVLDRTVARDVDSDTTDLVRKFIDENSLNDQVFVEATSKRYYPQNTLASHVIGFTGSDGTGLYGLELQYNDLLTGKAGKYLTARDSSGKELPIEYEEYVDSVSGCDINTTISSYVQSVLEKHLLTALEESGAANRACGIVMNVNTGAILGMATAPSFDLNDPWKLDEYLQNKLLKSGLQNDSDEYKAYKRQLLLETWSNKAVTEIYMPGSTFKIVTVSSALDLGVAEPYSGTFNCPGWYAVANRTIHCHKRKGHGTLTLAQGLQQSCNPVMMMLGQRIGTERFYSYVKQFGYLEKTGIDLPGEGIGLFYSESSFGEVDLAVSSFGQNFKVSAIQHIRAVASVANGGNLVTPYIVEKATDAHGNVVYSHQTDIKRQTVSKDVCSTVSEILAAGVAGDGGAKNAYVAGYRVAAKTGTSEKIGDDRDKRISSCVAYAPADSPEIAVIVIVDEPTIGSKYGSVVAAPYVGKIIEEIMPYLGVEAVYTDKELENMPVNIPDFVGWSVDTAELYAKNLDVNIDIRGVGATVVRQSPSSNQSFNKDSDIIILYTSDDITEKAVGVPDVVGLTAAQANVKITNAKLNIKIDGSIGECRQGNAATVVTQSPAAGNTVAEGSIITITLRYFDETDD